MAATKAKAGGKAAAKGKSAKDEPKFGVHSEVGQLRKVMVCAPGRAHARLTPSNCDQLLFDDVLWVENAKRDHFDFMMKMRDRGIEVVEMHNLLAETVAVPEGKKWILDNQVVPNQVGLGFIEELRSYLEGLSDRDLAETLIGATAHYVTPQLDEGPIIEQDIARITHAQSAEDYVSIGRDVESQVLARAIHAHIHHRSFINGNRTVVFPASPGSYVSERMG